MTPTPTGTRAPTAERGAGAPSTSKSRIDPRIRARRVAVTRKQGRRRLGVVVAVVALFTAAGAVWLALESPAFDVDRITVDGTEDVPVAAVVKATRIELGDALAFVDTGVARAAVEALGGVATATVERSFPGTLAITISEAHAVAWATRAVEDDQTADGPVVTVLIDGHGRVIEEATEPPTELTQIQGLAEIPGVGEPVRPARPVTLLGQLPEGLRIQVEMVIVDAGQVTLVLAPNLAGGASAQEIRLGEPRDIEAKGVAAAAVLGALEASVGYLDVRVPSAPATGG